MTNPLKSRPAVTLQRAGWHVTHGRRHIKAYCPCGDHMITLTGTPSDHRSERNDMALVKRTLRECPATPS